MDEPRVRTYDRHGEPHDEVLRTKSGRVLTEEDLARWAEEAAEAGGAEVTVTVEDACGPCLDGDHAHCSRRTCLPGQPGFTTEGCCCGNGSKVCGPGPGALTWGP